MGAAWLLPAVKTWAAFPSLVRHLNHVTPASQSRTTRVPFQDIIYRRTVRLLASHHGRLTPRFSRVGIVPDDAAGQRVFSGISRFPRACIPTLLCSHLTSPSYTPSEGSLVQAVHEGKSGDINLVCDGVFRQVVELWPVHILTTLIGSQDLIVKSRPTLSTQLFVTVCQHAQNSVYMRYMAPPRKSYLSQPHSPPPLPPVRCGGGEVVRLLTSHLGGPGSNPREVTSVFSHLGIAPDDAADRRVVSCIYHCIRRRSITP
ncbi:hypothetical protein PR048_024238 [Dryococelus australis]|uniref:Uncharacterized protein n=1 Tax=Dryococelus australis TaxID=614101 RepID=A0ABQ9GN25_9NEOP|nr:hypothetical protein PR048_024238 [Dryococelus australis]